MSAMVGSRRRPEGRKRILTRLKSCGVKNRFVRERRRERCVQAGDVSEQVLSCWVAPHADEAETDALSICSFNAHGAKAALVFQKHRHLARWGTFGHEVSVRNGSGAVISMRAGSGRSA